VLSKGGPVRRVQLADANHWVWTDYAAFAPQLQSACLMTATARAKLVGATSCGVSAVRKLVYRFFQQALANTRAGALGHANGTATAITALG
jgi:hypothetical protein